MPGSVVRTFPMGWDKFVPPHGSMDPNVSRKFLHIVVEFIVI